VEVKLTGGGKLEAPAGADFGGKAVKAAVFPYTPLPMGEGNSDIAIVGPVLQFEPSPHEFCTNKTLHPTCTSACAPTIIVPMAIAVPPGKKAVVYTKNTTSGLWEPLGGSVVALEGSVVGGISVLTCHWSTFGAMAAPLASSSPSYGPIGSLAGGGGGGGGGGGAAAAAAAAPAAALALSKSSSPSVEAEVVLAMAASEFSSRRAGNTSKDLFQKALAIASGVNALDVLVGGISANGADTKIVSGIKADDPQDVLTSLTLESLNEALASQGLPEAKSLVKRLIVVPETGLSTGAIVGIVIGVAVVLVAFGYFALSKAPDATPQKVPTPQEPYSTTHHAAQGGIIMPLNHAAQGGISDQLVYGQPLPITMTGPAPAFLPYAQAPQVQFPPQAHFAYPPY